MDLFDSEHNITAEESSWCAGVDTNKADSRRSREDLLKRAVNENYIVGAGHFHPDEHVGRVILMKGRRYWQAL